MPSATRAPVARSCHKLAGADACVEIAVAATVTDNDEEEVGILRACSIEL